jgi:hypothetical protein
MEKRGYLHSLLNANKQALSFGATSQAAPSDLPALQQAKSQQ